MDPLEAGAVHQAMPQGVMQHGARAVEQVQRGTDKPLTNDQRKAHMRLGEVIPATGGMQAQVGVMCAKREALTVIRIGRDAPHTEPSTRCEDTQGGDTQGMLRQWATAFEPLNRSLETFLTRLSRTNERSEKSRRVFKKPRCYKDESDGCIDTWIDVMKLHFEEEDLSERQESSALTSNLEGTSLNCVMAKKPIST